MLNLAISLRPDTSNGFDGVYVTDTTTNWGAAGNPLRADSALVLAAEWLDAGTAAGEVLTVSYDPLAFLALTGGDVWIPFTRDGLLRVVVAAVPVVTPVAAALLPNTTAYALSTGLVYVRNSALPADPQLEPADMLGQTPAGQPQVIAYTVAYWLADGKLLDALARLNLRYLRLPYQQQHALLALYERASLYHSGVQHLFDLARYLDAAATLGAAQYLLTTNGETPDDFGPVLGGFFPNTAI